MERTPSLTIEANPLVIRKSFKEIPPYRTNSLINEDIFQGNPYHIINNKSLTIYGPPPPIVEGKPSLIIEGISLLIGTHSRESLAIARNPLLWNEIPCYRKTIPYYRRKPLTIEGTALRMKTTNS